MLSEVERESLAGQHVAYLRLCLSRYPHDAEVAGTISALSAESADFRRLWAEHRVADWSRVTCHLQHPTAGTIETAVDVMKPSGDPDPWLVTLTTEPGSRSQEALRRLAA